MYLKSYRSVPEVIQGIGDYFRFYNYDRLHQWLDYQTPAMVHRKGNASLQWIRIEYSCLMSSINQQMPYKEAM